MFIKENMGSCFWTFMMVFFIIGIITFPFGIAIWIIQIYLIIKILKEKEN